MGCCGCSLSASTLTAVVLGLVESIFGMSWNILVIVVIEMQRVADRHDNFTINESTALFVDENGNGSSLWTIFRSTLTSEKALEAAHIFELSVTALVLNSFWLISTLALAVGNAEKCRDMLKPWIVTTVVITVTDIAATIYFVFKAVKDEDTNVDDVQAYVSSIFAILATLFSRGGPIVWVANIALCVYVTQRIKQIEVIKKKRMPFDADMHITPYSIQPPYEAYEADSYRCEKNHHRPNTPPPDYGEQRGGYRSKSHLRKHSAPSDCENSTLPISLRSGSSQRPLSASYTYDDNLVEMQHRASLSAEAHLPNYRHAYENRALDAADSAEGWMGIPRPTLKISR